MSYSLGFDIGAACVKLALVDATGATIHSDALNLLTSPAATVNALLRRLPSGIVLGDIAGAGVTGTGQGVMPAGTGWSYYSSALATATGVLLAYPDARTIIQIGAQNSLVVELDNGLEKPWKVTTNPLCAAGTGRFLEQQAYRLGVSLGDFAQLALEYADKPPRIAARCSVFAKSDLIHLQQKGVSTSAMLSGLCESVARLVVSLKKGTFNEPILLVGGVAGNSAILHALKEAASTRNGKTTDIVVPDNYLCIQAIGAARLAQGKERPASLLLDDDEHKTYYELPALPRDDVTASSKAIGINGPCRGYLGVDVGSTSTKAVILDETGQVVLAKSYIMTAGQPVSAIKQVCCNLLQDGAGQIDVLAAGITGSGRYLVGSLIGADLIKNEITAQSRAAAELDPEADVIEIGGQDSKLILKRRGIVTDYQMNKACAAGTGSFIDELAELLGVTAKNGDFARLALSAPYTVDLGSRCAAFIGQAVAAARQEGLGLDVITASLTNSVAKNYLSKVVAHRRLGKKIILTGAVFYNEAVVSAFRQQLPDKELLVAGHREVSGAMGVALLARDKTTDFPSHFKGFAAVAESSCELTSFTCKHCDNNCTITRMKLVDGGATYYGSRCDRYDTEAESKKHRTYFDARAELLFADYREGVGSGPTVGIPRALQVYDFAPLLLGFLKELGVKTILSGTTNQEIMEQAVELGYTDSCLPVKLLYGHTAAIKDSCDYVLYPCSIRMGGQEGNENQKYSCPLVQASPFMLRSALGLGKRLLAPILDFSRGEAEVVNDLVEVARELGFSSDRGREAASAGLAAQRRFEDGCQELGKKILSDLQTSGQLGAVVISRAYMSQDPGANLGVAEKLAKLGVVAVPLDCLPLKEIDPLAVSDRPYWAYESKFIAGATITARSPKLFGLFVGNFGCGPNSFILNIVEDIMGDKPLGQLEIDEHAAEAGLVTRLEAFADIIKSFVAPVEQHERDIRRSASPLATGDKILLVPRMVPHVDVLVAALNAYGVKAQALPLPDERNLELANTVTSGTECLPYRVTLGDFLRFCQSDYEHGAYEGMMAGSYGPCRLGKYVLEQNYLLRRLGYELPVRNSVSNNAYRDMGLGLGFQRLATDLIDAVDGLQRLLWRTRPYEKDAGLADRLFDEYLAALVAGAGRKESGKELLRTAARDFKTAIDHAKPRRPRVGINGEIYLRANEFSNAGLVRVCEASGLEVVVSSMGEWIKYILYRYVEDAYKSHNLRKMFSGHVVRTIRWWDEARMARALGGLADNEEPLKTLLAESGSYLSPRCGSEAVLSLGSGVCWMKDQHFAGVISVMPHGCMPGGIVASISEKISTLHNKPWISLTYDGFMENNNLARVGEFAELVKFKHNVRV